MFRHLSLRKRINFLPSQVGELLPDPHLFLKFLLFWGGFVLSLKKLFFCLSGFQIIGKERLNEWYWHLTALLLVTRCIYMRNIIVFWLWGLRPPPPPPFLMWESGDGLFVKISEIYPMPQGLPGRIWDCEVSGIFNCTQ